jgi:protocatechuate 3,4-dioxygenase beta subunit
MLHALAGLIRQRISGAVMKRRSLLRSVGMLATAAILPLPLARQAAAAPTRQGYDWPISALRAGGTAGLPAALPAPSFRTLPQCVVTLAKTRGPCHTNQVPIRQDVTEGVTGLPMRISLRLVDAGNCTPIRNADIEIWHADVRGVYSGRAAAMCNPENPAAQHAGFLRGRQVTDADGVVNFLTVYPGWYAGRTPHIHLRIVVAQREVLITQLLFDDALNEMVYRDHPDYARRPRHSTTNRGDMMFSASEIERFSFDVEKLDGGLLQATYTVGLKA